MRHAVVLGATGALGRETLHAFARQGWSVRGYRHDECDLVDRARLAQALRFADVVVNCAGAIPERARSPVDTILANAVGPRLLAELADARGIPVIHVSTDCVFSGRRPVDGTIPSYTVDDEPDAFDLYGRSKALGEDERVTVVRTSFVTPRHGLWAWLRRQAALGVETVPGYTRALWSGSTVEAVAEGLTWVADWSSRPPVVHLATRLPISKYMVLRLLVAHLGLGLRVEPTDEPEINRSLVPSLDLRPFAEALGDPV